METVKLSTLVRFVLPELQELLTVQELEMPVVLKNGIDSISYEDILEIIEATISHMNEKGVLLH
ncbi:hypothetical protein [Tepidibacillus fermentans]|uniref:Uncharacterized protein n=1 Tax=Tepidibacillus fermentans TaxID=1281767 RepID=A0A4R3KJC7_9BACI|nr:hypothetical protein [Tepidibacillus fermentans]TCS83699.1 hypothetical protein EDD72_10320 [Tepidibacillus fermentans]